MAGEGRERERESVRMEREEKREEGEVGKERGERREQKRKDSITQGD